MKSPSRTWIYLLIGSICVILFVTYRYGFEQRYLNISTQTAIIDLQNTNKAVLIEKHPEQKKIHQLELRIKGKLSDNITLHLSENGVLSATSIRIKQGKVDTSFLSRWSTDKAYILIENPNESKSTLEVDYQFISE
jgi:uncharacterized protein YuzE